MKEKWYIAGLSFECSGCGNCCSGPDEGFIWVTKEEVEFISAFLKIPREEFISRYTKKVGFRRSIIEEPASKDCIFLQDVGGDKRCVIYPVRPNQCRTWPFWTSNLHSPDCWNQTAVECAGINRGRRYSCQEIEKLRLQKKWWSEE